MTDPTGITEATAFPAVVRLGTRASALARWQTAFVARLLCAARPGLRTEVRVISTRGDRVVDTPLPLVGGKGLFTAELEAALRAGEIDLAVHSLKDLPTESPAGLAIGAVPPRGDPRDALVGRGGHTLQSLPAGAAVGTSSRRRGAQLLYRRPDLRLADVRGNVDTRLEKALAPGSPYDAILLACAGLERLGRAGAVSQVLAPDLLLPAPGQGALGVQCRAEGPWLELLEAIDDRPSRTATAAERAFLAGLGGGCALPIAAYAQVEDGRLRLLGRVTAPDGSTQIDVSGSVALRGDAGPAAAGRLGSDLAGAALARGAAALLSGAETEARV